MHCSGPPLSGPRLNSALGGGVTKGYYERCVAGRLDPGKRRKRNDYPDTARSHWSDRAMATSTLLVGGQGVARFLVRLRLERG